MAQSVESIRLCEICIGGRGEHYCQQCGQLFCGNCKLSHLRAKISKKHTFLSGQNINKEGKLLCPEHEESYLFCCHDCDTPVCRFCAVEKHSRHLMTDLTKYAEKQKNELLKIIKSKATTSSSYMIKIKEDAKMFREKTKAVIKTITEQGNYCKELIDKKVHSFVKLVQDEEQNTLQSMSTDNKVYLGILEKCQQWQNNLKEMETTEDVVLLKKLKHIKTDVDQIVLRQSPDTPRPSVSYKNKILSDTDIANLFGEFGCPRNTDVCPDCNRKEQHMHRNKAERNELKEDRQEFEKILTNYSSVGGRSDTEKENISLRAELTEALKNIEKIRQEYSNLSERYETGKIATKRTIESLQREKDSLEQEKANFRAKLDQIQSDLNRYKNEQVHEQDSSQRNIDNLLQQNRKLENDRELLRGKIFSLENDKIKLEDLLTFSLEDNTVLKRDLDRLKKHLEETQNQLSESEARYIGVGSISDTEKENSTLRLEVSEAVKDVVTIREQYGVLSNQYDEKKIEIENLQQDNLHLEHEKSNLKAKLESLQHESNLFKSDQLGKKNLYHEKMENLVQQKLQLENDKGLLRNKVYSLENEKIEIQERLTKLESNMKFLKEMKAENDDLKVSLAGAKRELESMEKKYKVETTIRLSYDEISTKCKDENESLKRERNLVKINLQKVLRENEELSRNLNAERDFSKAEFERKEKEKLELVALFNDKKDKDFKKIQRLECDIETLKSRFSTEERTKQYSSYESMQLKHDFEACKLQKKAVEDERDELKKEIVELDNQLQLNKSKKDCKKLQRDQDELQDIIREKSNELKDSEARYQKETSNRMSSDNISTKYKEDNDRLKKERNSARTELQRVLREKKESYQNFNTEQVLAKEELQSKEREKSELVALFKNKEHKDLQKIKLNEKEIKTLKSRCRDYNEKNRQSEHEIETLKSILKDNNEKIHRLEHEICTLKSSCSYEMLQNKCELEACKHKKKALEDERNDLQRENMELENELQSLNSKLEQIEDSEKNISNLKKHIKDLEEGAAATNVQTLTESVEDQKQENRDLIVKLENLDMEKKDLENKLRLEISSKENSSIHKENKELKNILQEKLEEVKRLEERCRHLQTLERDVQKLKRENKELDTEVISQRQNNEILYNRLEILNVEKLEIEDRLRRRSPQVVSESKSCQNCFKHRNDISDLKREINDLRDRHNPNIADLCDMNRPTSLAEKFSSLYTDEYVDAIEVIEDDMDEAASVKVMLDWLKKCYEWCQRLAKEQRETLINRSIGFMENHGGQNVVLSDRCLIFVKEFQKKIAVESLAVVGQICHVKSVTKQTLSTVNYIVKYIKKCSELCWMMQISDPPLYLNFDVSSGENLNKNDYNVFTKSGSKIDYLVWPVLYLHKTGPMLAKGVAQGK